MKCLYLSSYHLGSAPHELAALVPHGGRASIIMNALDEYGPRLPQQLAQHVDALAEIGIESDELDLRDHFSDEFGVREALADSSLVWAVGGNSFVLRRAMQASGLDAVARERVELGSLVWSGFSAGSVVVTPSLRGIDLVDDPTVLPAGYEGMDVIWDGLGLVDFSIAPHYRSEHPEAVLIDRVVAYLDEHGMPYRTLRDGEALVVRGTAERVVGTPS